MSACTGTLKQSRPPFAFPWLIEIQHAALALSQDFLARSTDHCALKLNTSWITLLFHFSSTDHTSTLFRFSTNSRYKELWNYEMIFDVLFKLCTDTFFKKRRQFLILDSGERVQQSDKDKVGEWLEELLIHLFGQRLCWKWVDTTSICVCKSLDGCLLCENN